MNLSTASRQSRLAAVKEDEKNLFRRKCLTNRKSCELKITSEYEKVTLLAA
jgi:hypothetical protein